MENPNQSDKLVRTKQIVGDRKSGIAALIPVSRSDWFAGIKSGKYPPPDVRLSARTVCWRLSTINRFIADGNYQKGERDE